MHVQRHHSIVLGFMLSSAACGASAAHMPARPSFQVEVGVESDPGEPLINAAISRAGRELGRTSSQGAVRLALAGESGDTIALEVSCPSGYASPDKPLLVTLRPLVGHTIPKYRARCQALVRSLVVAVRAKGGNDLTVKYHGREVARTDSEGAAHTLLRVAPAEQVTLMLDTSDAAHAQLRPKSPEFTVVMPERDEVAVFDQVFSQAPSKKPQRSSAPAHVGPVQIKAIRR
jgi:hypothetical protein